MHPRRWNESGEAVEQFERGDDQRATAAGSRLGVIVDEAFETDLMQPFQRERWAGTVRNSRSSPARSAASMRTAAFTENPPPCCHGCIACAASLSSRPRRTKLSRSRRRTLACTAAKSLGIDPCGRVEDDAAGGRRLEHAINYPAT